MWYPRTTSGSLERWLELPSWIRWRLLIWRIPRLTRRDVRKLQVQGHCCSRITAPSTKRPRESLSKFFLGLRIGGPSRRESLHVRSAPASQHAHPSCSGELLRILWRRFYYRVPDRLRSTDESLSSR